MTDYARTLLPVREVSIGDYVLGGGEPAVLVMAEAICRLLPGVLGNADSAPDDSFGAGIGPELGLGAGPASNRPKAGRGLAVPDVLLSGIRDDRRRRADGTTPGAARPDLAAGWQAAN